MWRLANGCGGERMDHARGVLWLARAMSAGSPACRSGAVGSGWIWTVEIYVLK
jgi:hypothetical protein